MKIRFASPDEFEGDLFITKFGGLKVPPSMGLCKGLRLKGLVTTQFRDHIGFRIWGPQSLRFGDCRVWGWGVGFGVLGGFSSLIYRMRDDSACEGFYRGVNRGVL